MSQWRKCAEISSQNHETRGFFIFSAQRRRLTTRPESRFAARGGSCLTRMCGSLCSFFKNLKTARVSQRSVVPKWQVYFLYTNLHSVGQIPLIHHLELGVEGDQKPPSSIRTNVVLFKRTPSSIFHMDTILSVAADPVLLTDWLSRFPHSHARQRIPVNVILFYERPSIVMNVDSPRLCVRSLWYQY